MLLLLLQSAAGRLLLRPTWPRRRPPTAATGAGCAGCCRRRHFPAGVRVEMQARLVGGQQQSGARAREVAPAAAAQGRRTEQASKLEKYWPAAFHARQRDSPETNRHQTWCRDMEARLCCTAARSALSSRPPMSGRRGEEWGEGPATVPTVPSSCDPGLASAPSPPKLPAPSPTTLDSPVMGLCSWIVVVVSWVGEDSSCSPGVPAPWGVDMMTCSPTTAAGAATPCCCCCCRCCWSEEAR